MGLGSHVLNWGPTLPALLAQDRQVILFDNRGSGRSSQPPGPYTMTDFVEDTAALMGHCGISQADVFGVSMGGMIAQHLALRYPERIDRLILGCTTVGGKDGVRAEQAILDMLKADPNLDPFDAAWQSLATGYTDEFIAREPERLAAQIRRNLRYRSQPHAFDAQLDAIVKTHRTFAHLGRIGHPTLVLTGDADRLIPPQNSQILAQGLPNARLALIPNAGHAFWISHPEEAADAVEGFLRGT
jgi:pimeloyl-ACP methyl ester carboxylesterase